MDDQRPEDIPSELTHLVQLNIAYRVLICPYNECCKAVQPRAFSEHLRVQHQTPLRDRERVQEYVSIFGWDYDFSSIQLPRDGSGPQPIIPVVDGFQCRTCPFKSSNRKSMKVHGNKEHKQQRVDDDELFEKVRLQSWFQDHRQRYWVVDESERGGGRDQEEDSPGRSRSRGDEDVADTSTDRGSGAVKEAIVMDAGDGEVAEAVVDKEISEVVVDDGEEVLSDFEDSGDEDYRESSEVAADQSDDEDYEESSGVAENDDEGLSEVRVDRSDDEDGSSRVADDDGEVIAVRPGQSKGSNPRKRKTQSKWKDGRVGGIDSEDDTYRDLSPGFRGRRRRATKRPRFDDSGVVMGSSQDDSEIRPSSQHDGIVPPSSPPVPAWMIGRRQGVVDDKLRFPGSPKTMTRAVHGGDGGMVQWRLDQLRKRLEKWCRTCPACHLAGDFGGETHHITDCWRRDTVEIIEQAVVMQQHVERVGGFRGRGGCSRCGVPRAICQGWQVKADGDWEEVPGQQCQYTGMLIPAVVTMLMDGSNEGWAVVESWMDRDGVIGTKPAEAFEWFRQGRWWDDMEVEAAQIVRVFYMLVNKNKGVRIRGLAEHR